jgi:hypothetical protein
MWEKDRSERKESERKSEEDNRRINSMAVEACAIGEGKLV